MGVEESLGHQIWHRAGRWEVFDADGNLVAEGRGSATDAQHWIWEGIIEMAPGFAHTKLDRHRLVAKKVAALP